MSVQEAKDLAQRGQSMALAYSAGRALDLGDGRVLKTGNQLCRSEAMAMQFVRERTSIPIPRVFAYACNPGVHVGRRTGYVLMEKLPGVALVELLEKLKPREVAVVTKQLQDVVSQLRTLDDPLRWGMVGKGGAFHGGYFSHGEDPAICRPSSPHAIADIYGYFLASISPPRRAPYEAGGRYESSVAPEHGSVFSHADLRPENILVDPSTLHITGIVDWAWAGWYPRFWDRLVADRAYCSYETKPAAHKVWHCIYEKVFPLHSEEAKTFNWLLMVAEDGHRDYGLEWCDCCKI
ncbi:kinase-like protein [Peniophora sp. CONT]|nr:kinase-like protein [Peniophora sp. CONT]